ncbi:MAG: T9SS type A sorting domain-containing protein, partial [Bacteroidia bacterium]
SSKTFKVFNDATNTQIFSINVSTGTMKNRLTAAAEFNSTVSVVNNTLNNNLKLYPNPTNGNSSLDVNLVENTNVTVDVLNTLGQVVFTKTLTNVSGSQKVNIDSQNFESGLYLVNIKVGDNVTTKKLTVTK